MMTFKRKFELSINKLDTNDRPNCAQEDINHYADFIELLALLSGEDGVSYGDIQDRFYGEPDEKNDSERNDKNESFIDEIFTLIEERISLFQDNYPFNKSNDVISLKSRLSVCHKIYIFLLLSSSLDIFYLFKSELTRDFETLCYEAMRSYLPNAIVKAFGENSEYTGSAKEKIVKLAKDIGLPIDEYEIQQIKERNMKDRGLDIVSWLPFKDNCSNLVIFLGQCACGKKYESKQHDTRRFENYYQFYKTKPQHTIFIPYSLVNPKAGKFYESDIIEKDYLVFERLRLIQTLKRNQLVYKLLKSKKLIEKCIQHSLLVI